MNKITKLILIGLLLVPLAGTIGLNVQAAETGAGRAPQTFYVSPSGSDDNEGVSQVKPWGLPLGAGVFTDCYLGDCTIYDIYGDPDGYQTGTFDGSGPTCDNIIRYNISQNDAKKNPGASGGIMTWGSQQRGHIYNNTVFISAGLNGVQAAAFLGNGKGLTLCNNIFVANHDGDIVKSGEGCTFRNNCYYRVKGGFSVTYAKKHYTSLSEWQNATGQEKLDGAPIGFSVAPQHRTPGGGVIGDAANLGALTAYDLLPTSPLIGKGLDLQALFKLAKSPYDFRGTPLPAETKPDLGAIQHR